MDKIPVTETAVIIRTDFSDDRQWSNLKRIAMDPPDPFHGNFEFIENSACQEKELEELLQMLPKDYPHPVLFVADEEAMAEKGFPCLVVDLLETKGQTFRAIARQLASIENNLSIANMGFEEFADAVDAEGVFRGF
ncbi:MAG: hypothetical protein H0X66_02835 [Verrucomicrobia bacterium]|nr:hypothetical protein [Verrucomicrobiota bacterium]